MIKILKINIISNLNIILKVFLIQEINSRAHYCIQSIIINRVNIIYKKIKVEILNKILTILKIIIN